jgi:hypothetical protein
LTPLALAASLCLTTPHRLEAVVDVSFGMKDGIVYRD